MGEDIVRDIASKEGGKEERKSATLLYGKPIAEKIKEKLIPEILKLKEKGAHPRLGVVFAGEGGAAKVYANSKKRLGEALGIIIDFHTFPEDTPEGELMRLIPELNFDPNIHGVIVEMPLPPQINANKILGLTDPLKDVDGSHVVNRGRLLRGEDIKGTLFPVTPLSCLSLLKSAGVSPLGKKVTIVGRGETVGLPLAVMLIRMSATVTVCHTKTEDLKAAVNGADIVITACGVPGLVKAEYLKPGQIVIDAGISNLPDGTVAGDTDPRASEIVSYLSPVPGGVGALTGILLMRNLIKAVKLQKGL